MIDSFTIHPYYEKRSFDHDLALFELEEPIDFDKYPNIRPACLPSQIIEPGTVVRF